MNVSYFQLIAPLVGALLGWLASKGIQAPPDTANALTGLGAALIGGLVHFIEAWVTPKTPPPVTLAAGRIDPAMKAPPGGGSGGNVAKALIGALAVGLLLHLSGCAALGLAPAQTPAQKLGYAYGAVTGALNTLGQALAAGQVSSAEAARVNADIMDAASELDTARTLLCGADPKCASPASSSSALTIITAATAALGQVSSYLTCKQSKGATCPLP